MHDTAHVISPGTRILYQTGHFQGRCIIAIWLGQQLSHTFPKLDNRVWMKHRIHVHVVLFHFTSFTIAKQQHKIIRYERNLSGNPPAGRWHRHWWQDAGESGVNVEKGLRASGNPAKRSLLSGWK